MRPVTRCGTSDIKKITEKRLEWYRQKCEAEGRRIHAMKKMEDVQQKGQS